MLSEEKKSLSDFWVIGINFRNCNATLRGTYALNDEKYNELLHTAPSFGLTELFVLSTCNRTEIYGFAKDSMTLSTLLCTFTEGSLDDFLQLSYQKKGKAALAHIYHVAGGLDSQILGDHEIIGQMKHAVCIAKEQHCILQFTDRLFKSVLQSCRAIRSETRLSNGSVSVAHAAVQFLKTQNPGYFQKKILLIGTGKIGQITCKNLMEEVPPENITLTNRTDEKALDFANPLKLQAAPYSTLNYLIAQSDIIIVATNAPKPVLNKENLGLLSAKLLLDLSIPHNIDPALKEYSGIILSNVDDLSRISTETLLHREEEIPKAKALINFYIHDFAQWYLMRKNVPVLKAVKQKLEELNTQLFEAKKENDTKSIQRILNTMALKMKEPEQKPGCYYIEAMEEYIIKSVDKVTL